MECEHKKVTFPKTPEAEEAALKHLTVNDVRAAFPRFFGKCSCGFEGIAYASKAHYVAGDW